MTLPPVVRSILKADDFSGKTIIPLSLVGLRTGGQLVSSGQAYTAGAARRCILYAGTAREADDNPSNGLDWQNPPVNIACPTHLLAARADCRMRALANKAA